MQNGPPRRAVRVPVTHRATVPTGMENSCVIRRKDGNHNGQLIGPFDLPAEAVSHAMGTLGLDSSQFVLEVLCLPTPPGRPLLKLVSDDAA